MQIQIGPIWLVCKIFSSVNFFNKLERMSEWFPLKRWMTLMTSTYYQTRQLKSYHLPLSLPLSLSHPFSFRFSVQHSEKSFHYSLSSSYAHFLPHSAAEFLLHSLKESLFHSGLLHHSIIFVSSRLFFSFEFRLEIIFIKTVPLSHSRISSHEWIFLRSIYNCYLNNQPSPPSIIYYFSQPKLTLRKNVVLKFIYPIKLPFWRIMDANFQFRSFDKESSWSSAKLVPRKLDT